MNIIFRSFTSSFVILQMLISMMAYGDDLPSPEKTFKAHYIDHINEGCPENSDCSEESGLYRLAWLNLIQELSHFQAEKMKTLGKDAITKKNVKAINRFVQKSGLPFEFYLTQKIRKFHDIISWDSSCPLHHKNQSNPIERALVFFQGISNNSLVIKRKNQTSYLPMDEDVRVNRINIYGVKGKQVLSFPLSIDDTPIALNKKRQIELIRSEKDVYFGVQIDTKGQTTIIPPPDYPLTHRGSEVDCPSQVKDSWNKFPSLKNFYGGYFCRQIWDETLQKFLTAQFFWTCP